MPRLPVISGRDAVRAFEKIGFTEHIGRGKGSHIIVVRQDPPTVLAIPGHKEIKRGTLRGLIRQAGLSVEDFINLL